MLTIFAVPKPFRGKTGIIQRNAIGSWLQLRPKVEVILLGEDDGTEAIAREFGVRHIPEIACSEHGTPLVHSIFEIAEKASSCSLLAYVNSDIILMSDFLPAVKQLQGPRFLLVGRRWDIDVEQPINFQELDWESRLRERVARSGSLYVPSGLDYFVFSRGLWGEIPPFALGRTIWDNWLVYRARSTAATVVDATNSVLAVHQNHDYSHVPGGRQEAWKGIEARKNRLLVGSVEYCFDVYDATYVLSRDRILQSLDSTRLHRRIEHLAVLAPGNRVMQRFRAGFLWILWQLARIFSIFSDGLWRFIFSRTY